MRKDIFMDRQAVLDPKVRKSATQFLRALQKKGLVISGYYVFGSQINGKAHKWSDIDIGIISPNFSDDRFEERIKLMRIGDEIDTAIEPHPFTPEDFEDKYYSLAQEVKKTGIKI